MYYECAYTMHVLIHYINWLLLCWTMGYTSPKTWSGAQFAVGEGNFATQNDNTIKYVKFKKIPNNCKLVWFQLFGSSMNTIPTDQKYQSNRFQLVAWFQLCLVTWNLSESSHWKLMKIQKVQGKKRSRFHMTWTKTRALKRSKKVGFTKTEVWGQTLKMTSS